MTVLHQRVVPAGVNGTNGIDATVIRTVRGRPSNAPDRRFLIIALLSVGIHLAFIFFVRKQEVAPPTATVIEKVPERFAQFIIEKPIPKTETEKKTAERTAEATVATESVPQQRPTSGAVSPAQRTEAQRSVEARVARVEQKVRTVGVLGMLTGAGTTAKGPAVVDVLGSIKDRRESSVDLEAALEKMTGLQKTRDVDVLDRKLVKSKDLAVSRKESIDDLLASVGSAKTVELTKRGSFIIQRPESIEGAASSSAKRDNDAINAIVASHRASIRMSYEKYLKRDPALAGKVTIRFTIAASGSIAAVTVLENTTGNKELEDEIVRKIRMWRFEEIPDGDVTVTYPFLFSSAG
jgi:TonB family protein